jgi:hypothetical protein
MRENAEFRIDEDFAHMLFADHEGKRMGAVRKVTLETSDPRYKRVGELQKSLLQSKRKPFFYGWSLSYQYSSSELEAAALLHLKRTSFFEPAGEERGTKYDETAACPICGAGAPQTTPLYLPENRIPKSKDLSQTIAGEIVVSRKIKELFARHRITGARLNAVRYSQRSSAESSDWFQLIPANPTAEIVSPTKIGSTLFDEGDDEQYYPNETAWHGLDALPPLVRLNMLKQINQMKKEVPRCPNGDAVGLNLLSEVSIEASTKPNSDIVATRQFLGCRRGLLRQQRLILISPRLYGLLAAEKIKGFKVDVAHLV